MRRLIITADDYGYSPRYDEGILAAAEAGALDAVSVMVGREGMDATPLLASGVGIGLHLELGYGADAGRASAAERDSAAIALERQCERFGELFGRPPDHLDSHHHGHAREGLGVLVSNFATARGLPVRSVSPRHRRLLRCRGVRTPDLLIGRLSEAEAELPAELRSPEGLPAVTEWMVHPGGRDSALGSSFDGGREEDLKLLLRWSPPPGLRRSGHAEALAP